MKVGIFFGGASREREISFAGGRTVYDNLDKTLFEPVPIFVDSYGNFILLDWQYIYKGTIRDFYPPFQFLQKSDHSFQLYIESLGLLSQEEQTQIASCVGQRIYPHEFHSHFQFAFLCLHGPYGEDGTLQGMLEWYKIPYSGSGILPSAIGISKSVQKNLLTYAKKELYRSYVFTKDHWWNSEDKEVLLSTLIEKVGFPFVVKAPNQGSSIGISLISEKSISQLEQAVLKSLFIQKITRTTWISLSDSEKTAWVRDLADIKIGIGMPVAVENVIIYKPDELLAYLENHFEHKQNDLYLQNTEGEEQILVESYLKGKEFSCIVIQQKDGTPLALPPTEIIKKTEVFDYRSKYLPGMVRKVTPIDLPQDQIEAICNECCTVYKQLFFNVYARIDGFITEQGDIFLNDPNTTSGMMPSSFFFHQAAEIGLTPSQFLTYIVHTSVSERLKSGKNNLALHKMHSGLESAIQLVKQSAHDKIKVAVIMGGWSSERHISVESGRNIFEKLSSSTKYQPIAIFLTGSADNIEMYRIPVNIMLKDNADDIKENIVKALTLPRHAVLDQIVQKASDITATYSTNAIYTPVKVSFEQLSDMADVAFIALHGRPGEDGQLQIALEKVGIPYNGSGAKSSEITINKFETNRLLREHGVKVAAHQMAFKSEWNKNKENFYKQIEDSFSYPFIAKPHDDGCSSAVKKIKNREELDAYSQLIFREKLSLNPTSAEILNLRPTEEFSAKNSFLVETLIDKQDSYHFLEVTGGLVTRWVNGERVIEMFEPSETLASGEILSLEEKFLAGEGQNITPARFSTMPDLQQKYSLAVTAELKKVAEILQIEGYCRIDAFVRIFKDSRVEVIIIEVNSLPGMTPATCIFHQCALSGYKPYDFIDAILTYGMEKKHTIKEYSDI